MANKIIVTSTRKIGTTQEQFIARYEGFFVKDFVGKTVAEGTFPPHQDYRRDYIVPDDPIISMAPDLFLPDQPLDFHVLTSETFQDRETMEGIVKASTSGDMGTETWDVVFTMSQRGQVHPFIVDERIGASDGRFHAPRTNKATGDFFKLAVLTRKPKHVSADSFLIDSEKTSVPLFERLVANGEIPAPIDYRRNYVLTGDPSEATAPAGFFAADVGFGCITEITLKDRAQAEPVVRAYAEGAIAPRDSGLDDLRLVVVDQWVGYGDDPKASKFR